MKQIKLLPTHKFFMMLVIIMSLVFAAAIGAHSQNVVREGKTFTVVQSDSTKSGKYTKTEYTYRDKTGEYPIFLSQSGSAFIFKVSKKTGKEYRKYLPEVTKQLGTKDKDHVKKN